MKKKTKITLFIISLVWLLGVIICCTVIYKEYKEEISQGEPVVKTEEEIINIFKDNRDMFIDSAESLYPFKYHWSLRWKDKYNPFFENDWKYINLKNNIQLTIKQKEVGDILSIKSEAEESKGTEKILKDLEFAWITTYDSIDSNCIYFVENQFGDIGSGIVYCPENLPQNMYITSLKEIEPSWYYFDSK